MNENINNKEQFTISEEDSFMKMVFKKRLNQKGLTLIELLAVIVILAIVAAIAIPSISNLIANQRDKAVLADASTIISAAKLADTAGDCDLEAASTADTACDQGTLGSYVDGISSTSTYYVQRANTAAAGATENIEITLTFSELNRTWNLSPAPTTSGTGATTAITEENLNAALD